MKVQKPEKGGLTQDLVMLLYYCTREKKGEG